jgi:internalin A
MTRESGGVKKRRLLKTFAVCVIAASAFILLFFAYNVNSSRTKSYKESEMIIDEIIARQLHKDPNMLNSEDFEKVRNVDISGNKVTNLNPLAKLKNLESIIFYVSPNQEIHLYPLAKLINLKKLQILRMSGQSPSSGRPLFSSTTKKLNLYDKILSILKISKYSDFEIYQFDLGQLRNIKSLKTLNIQGFNVNNIKALAALSNLEYLVIHPAPNRFQVVLSGGNNIKQKKQESPDLSPIKNLTKLLHLDITDFKARDYIFCEKLTRLKYLELNGTQINDIKSSSGLANLEYLGLRGAGIKDINSLSNLINLKELNLSNTKVIDVNALKKLTELTNLNLTNVPVSDEQIAELQKALPELKIQR